ncbi:hypothetical protein ACHAW6_013073 [Cyclotella cf. meneghiniana]
MISMKSHSPNSRQSLRLALLASTILTPFSHGLPRGGSKKDNTFNSNSLARRTGPTGESRRDSALTTLRDSFPCEADAGSSSSSSSLEGRLRDNVDGSSGGGSSDFSSKSNEARNRCSFASNPFDAPRGGGDIAASKYDDDEIDRMVEDLIAGVESGFGSEGLDDLDDAHLHVETLLGESVDEETNNYMGSSHPLIEEDLDEAQDEDSNGQTFDCIRGAIDSSSISTKHIQQTNHRDSSKQSPASSGSATTTNLPTTTTSVSERTPMTIPTTIPTNAYYRFLVRRGPKGHILASFSLLSVQWIQTYLPFLYRFVASLLLTCRIYDPSLLRIKERERLLAMQRRKERTTLTQKLKNKFSSQSSARKRIQKEADQRAALKLQQLLKTTMATSLDWKEVRYRYLSVGFRKRHELGAEYVKKKPVLFMGEEVGGGVEDGDVGGVVVDLEEELDIVASEEPVDVGVGGQKKQDGKSKKQPRRKRKITDWVVQAFASQSPSSLSTKQSIDGSSPISNSASSLWKSVECNAILNAAWESRNAEKLIWANSNKKDPMPGMAAQRPSENDKTSNFSSAGASKMFQSVMTRVGSNGRILGAYPMDAPPIEECANRRGVLDLARRYGYGNWVEDGGEENWEESGGEEEESWGGGDLFFDDVKEKDDRMRKGLPFTGELSKVVDSSRHQTIRRKKHPTDDESYTKPTTSTRKKKRKNTSQTKLATIAFSGGGPTISTPQRKVTFEFGIGAQSSQRRNDLFRSSTNRMKQTTKPPTERNVESIRSQLQERTSSIIITSDTRVKAPMQLLNKSMKKHGKKDKGEIE